MDNNLLGKFITRYLQEHNMTVSEFSKKTKIAHSTIDRWIAGDYKYAPNLDALNRLAVFTAMDLCDLVQFFYPQKPRGINPDTTRLAEQISHLPIPAQELIDSIILGLSIKSNKKDTNVS